MEDSMTTHSEVNQDPYAEEREKLDDVIRTIRARTANISSQLPARAGDTRTADAVQQILLKQAATLDSALQQPYFGRVDYQQLDPMKENANAIYIGKNQIPDTNVISWIAPVARLWYTGENRYTAPYGEIRARVDLKRFLRIRDQELVELNDIYRRALPAGAAAVPNPALTAALSGTGASEGSLSVIIETIEPDQYENIANVSDQALVIQGAAGSGKSEIGFHRIAYLLSPFNELADRERPTPTTTIFIGPSPSFLEYAADVLPDLGVRETIKQTTCRGWLADHLSSPVTARSRIWGNLLEKGEMTDFDETSEAFKGSMNMADALERYVRSRWDAIHKAARNLPPLTATRDGRRLTVGASDINAALDRVFANDAGGFAPNAKRRQFVDAIANLLWGRNGLAGRARDAAASRRQSRVAAVIEPWLERLWPRLDFRQEYVGLLSNPEMLSRLSRGAITAEVARRLDASARYALSGEFEDADLGALAYLDHLLNNTIRPYYRHIVVDEAQDISPIEFRLLRLNSWNNWFTILGDTAQQLTPYRGIRRWRDLERPLGRSAVKVQHARTSYRSNQHITRFNNRILRLFDTYIDAPIPFGREGHRVELHRHGNSANMYRNITGELARVRSLDGMADAQIAILVRDRYNLRQFQKFCAENGIEEVTLFGQGNLASQTILARIPDVKGLEYDAVIVMGVNDSFASTTFNQKLLYLAATRARHYLAIHWARRHSPVIKAISDRGIRKFNHQ